MDYRGLLHRDGTVLSLVTLEVRECASGQLTEWGRSASAEMGVALMTLGGEGVHQIAAGLVGLSVGMRTPAALELLWSECSQAAGGGKLLEVSGLPCLSRCSGWGSCHMGIAPRTCADLNCRPWACWGWRHAAGWEACASCRSNPLQG